MITARLSKLNYNEILLYLGHRGQEIPTELEQQIHTCMEQIMETMQPRLVYQILPVTDGKAEGFWLPGEDIPKLLKEARQAVLLAVTLGPETDRMLQKAEVCNMAEALIMDACASAAVENVCNNFCADLEKEWKEQTTEPIFLTDRFSPGYGDLPLDTQKLFCEKLNTGRRIGMNLTPSSLMIPRKSVTAILGICDTPQKKRRGCEDCNMFQTCEFRKKGYSCYE